LIIAIGLFCIKYLSFGQIYSLSDHQDILKLIAENDRAAFQRFYVLYAEKVYNTAISYVQDHHAAEEVTQDVFTNVYRKAASFKGQSAVGTWVYRITVNTSLNYIKSKKRFSFLRISDREREKADFEHPGVQLENKENAKALFAVIDTLPDKQKTAFILSFVEDLPRQEVADIMEMSLKAVESLLQRAKKNMREKLEKMYPERRK